MKQKKTVVLLALLLAMLATTTACGEKSKDDISGTVTPVESTGAPMSEEGTKPVSETEDDIEDSASAEADLPSLSLGRMEGGVYTNNYLGITCQLDSSWQFYTSEELQDLPGDIAQLIEGSELGDAISGMEQIIDVQAENSENLTSFNVLYQKLSVPERLAFSKMSEEEIIDELIKEYALLEDGYAQMGMEMKEISSKKVTFLGEERTGLLQLCDVGGSDYYIFQLMNYNLGEYGTTITFASLYEDKTQEVMDLFSPIN